MSWVRVDDALFTNPKFVELEQGDKLLLLASWCFCSAGLTDGRIPGRAVPILLAQSETDPGGPARLMDAGLWDEGDDSDSYLVHDYLAYNPSREQVLASREQRRSAGAKGGQAKAVAKAVADAKAPAKRDAKHSPQSPSLPTPQSSPTVNDPREAACGRILAQRDMDRAELRSNEPIRNKNAWLKEALRRRLDTDGPEIRRLATEHPDWTPEELAAGIEPTEPTGAKPLWQPRVVPGALSNSENSRRASSLKSSAGG